jgi:hypothetical protein
MRRISNYWLTLRGLVAATVVGGMALLSSCNGDEAQQGPKGDPSREVMFLAYAQKGSRTRVQDAPTSNITNFNAFAIWSVDGKPLDNLSPAKVERADNTSPWTYTPKQRWPETGKIDFYAYSPDDADGLDVNYDKTHYTAADLTIDYKVPAPPTILNNASRQQDLLVAVKPNVDCSMPGPVSLNFQHVLSRIQLKARLAVKNNAEYSVSRVRFVHLSDEGNLALSTTNIPDGDGFTYNDVLDRLPLVLWTAHNNAEAVYDFVFGTPIKVNHHINYTDIITLAQAILVLPQTTKIGEAKPLSEFVDANDPADPADDKFYIRIDFVSSEDPDVTKVKYFAVREPLDPARNLPLSFEAGRSYTFVVDLSDYDYINFADVKVADFDEAFAGGGLPYVDITNDPDPVLTADAYMPAPHKGWAGSNIYWDGTKLTFADIDYDPTTDPANDGKKTDDPDYVDKSQYQGLYFKWGSLVGISPVDAWGGTTVLYAPHGVNGAYAATTATALASGNWDNIKTVTTDLTTINGVDEMRKSGYVTYLNTVPANFTDYLGDICAYLSGRPGVPDGFWRMPTSAEFEPEFPAPFVSPGDYAREGTVNDKNTADWSDDEYIWTGPSNDKTDGTYAITNGYRLKYFGKFVFFPASGNRSSSNGVLYDLGLSGTAWSSSPRNTSGRDLGFNATGVGPARSNSRALGFPVRCVKK